MADNNQMGLNIEETSWNEVKNNGLKWIDFYTEFADKLLQYKDDRKGLINKIQRVLDDFISITKKKYPQLTNEGEDLMDIDPFTVFGIFNKGFTDDNRKIFMTELAKEFGIDAFIPNKCRGIPTTGDNRRVTFYNIRGKRKDHDIDNLWNFFEAALALEGNDTKENRKKFSDYYKGVCEQTEIGPKNLFTGLYWIRPNYFLPLDQNTRAFITKTENMPLEFVNLAIKLEVDDENKMLNAEDYLKLRDECEEVLKTGEYMYKTIPELSYAAWYVNKKADKKIDDTTDLDETGETKNENLSEAKTDKVGKNILYYGVPGSGKSFLVKEKIKEDDQDMERTERVVFHPEYTYSDFVGQILPRVIEKKGEEPNLISYNFMPGPFTRILKKANKDAGHMHYLVIEEINRGNAPAIFGDIFQLLDRKYLKKDEGTAEYGKSEYEITNSDIAKEVYNDKEKKVALPFNLTIYATMNTSDQNVFTLDTAFQRRWEMKLVENDFTLEDHDKDMIGGSSITWGQFASAINDKILSTNDALLSSEDKRLGAFFVTKEEVEDIEKFSQKVLKYLWDDAFKLNRSDVFNDLKSLEEVIKRYNEALKANKEPLEEVFKEELYRKMVGQNKDAPEEEAHEINEEND